MVELRTGKNENGITEYYLNNLDTYESFESVITELRHIGINQLDQLDGIYSRTALFEVEGKKFKIIFHEDVGVYAFSESGLYDEKWLSQIMKKVVRNLNDQ